MIGGMKPYLIEMIAWNTRCLYTKAGQRIAAARMSDGTVPFYDIDRCIMGTMEKKLEGEMITDQWVMVEYLHNRYRSWIDDSDIRAILMDAAKQAPELEG